MHPRMAANCLDNSAKPDTTLAGERLSELGFQLHVMTRIRAIDLHTIYRSGPELIQLIESGNVDLNFSAVQFGEGDTVTLYHYWDLGRDANRLYELELTIPDEPAYAKFDRLIIEEIKDLTVPASKLVQPKTDPREVPSPVYLRACYQLHTEKLPEFVALMESSAFPFGVSNGWILKDAVIGLTGRANQIVQTWIIPHDTAPTAQHRLMTAAWQEMADAPPVCQVLTPTPSDPTLGNPTLEKARQDRHKDVAALAAAAAVAGKHPHRRRHPFASRLKTNQQGGAQHANSESK